MRKRTGKLAWAMVVTMVMSIFAGVLPLATYAAGNEVSVTFHFYRAGGNYDGWDIWGWIPGLNGAAYAFTEEDSFGKVAKFKLDNSNNSKTVGFILRRTDWSSREFSDRMIDIKDGKAEIWVISNEEEIFYSEAEAKGAIVPKIRGASISTLDKIRASVNVPIKLTDKTKDNIKVTVGGSAAEVTSVVNPNAIPAETAGYEVLGDKIHFVFVPGKFTVEGADAAGKSKIFVAGGMNGWNGQGAEGWALTWNADKKYYELTKDLGKDVTFGNAFKYINVIDENKTNWMSGNDITIVDFSTTVTVEINLKNKLPVDKAVKFTIDGYQGEGRPALSGAVFTSKEFEDAYVYEGDDLGITYSKDKTSFRLWAPLAEKVVLMTYKDGDPDSKEAGTPYEMKKDVKGTWVATVNGDLNGTFYTYKVTNYGTEIEAGDPYAIAVGVNGDRSAVVDISTTNPEGWDKDKRPAFSGNPTDAVVYELHIRDLSMHKDSGIKNKGKYVQFTEEGTKGPKGVTTGIDHLKELGITHLHLLPSYDYASIDEKTLDKNNFNWGYDPENYNVPEGGYSTDPYKPEVRIKEYKQMVQALHKNGIRVIFDAVYNHTFDNFTAKLHRIVPGYYYRMAEDGTFLNGTGVNSETASERKMFHKYMVKSFSYWVKEYHIDGFRVDLMGIHDQNTMNEVRKALTEIDPTIMIFGEGWDMGNLPRDQRAIQPFAEKMPGIGFFNDNVRDNLKGSYADETDHGYIDGRRNAELDVIQGVAGGIRYSDIVKDYNFAPGQSMNYVANHDNNTLWDKLLAANPKASTEDLKKMHKLANTVVFTSQGVSYLHAGEEFLRTKGGDENSFVSPDSVNQFDWERKAENLDTVEYYKGLIELRKTHPAFRMPTVDLIKQNLSFVSAPRNTVAFVLKNNANGDSWKNIFVAYNSNKTPVTVKVPTASWNVVVKDGKAGVATLETVNTSSVTVDSMSAIVMYTDSTVIVDDMFATAKVVKTQVGSDKLITANGEVTAEEKLSLEKGTIYLPAKAVAQAIGARVKEDKEKYLEIKNGKKTIKINLKDLTFKVNGVGLAAKYDIKLKDGKLMVSREFVEDVLNVKVFADASRYNENTARDRAESSQPDIYILY
ncbi:MAG: type I pullulanase [Clostridia bacterium]|nr:type I pullulanase [Clostridia bacterium]